MSSTLAAILDHPDPTTIHPCLKWAESLAPGSELKTRTPDREGWTCLIDHSYFTFGLINHHCSPCRFRFLHRFSLAHAFGLRKISIGGLPPRSERRCPVSSSPLSIS